jgi:hypothetical protein
MANVPVDPWPHLPTGFSFRAVPCSVPTDRARAFLVLSSERAFENAAIAKFFP